MGCYMCVVYDGYNMAAQSVSGHKPRLHRLEQIGFCTTRTKECQRKATRCCGTSQERHNQQQWTVRGGSQPHQARIEALALAYLSALWSSRTELRKQKDCLQISSVPTRNLMHIPPMIYVYLWYLKEMCNHSLKVQEQQTHSSSCAFRSSQQSWKGQWCRDPL